MSSHKNKFHGPYPGLTLSRHALVLETSLSKPAGSRLSRPAVTAPCRQRQRVSRTVSTPASFSAGRGLNDPSKAQTFLLAAPVRPGATNKIDQGRSLSLRAPQGCLRVWVRRIRPTVREQVDLHRRLGSYPAYLSTPRRPSSHPRGFRLFTCQRAVLLKSYVSSL